MFSSDNGAGASLQGGNNMQGCFTLEESFFIRDVLAFSIDKYCWLSLEAYWGNLVKVLCVL